MAMKNALSSKLNKAVTRQASSSYSNSYTVAIGCRRRRALLLPTSKNCAKRTLVTAATAVCLLPRYTVHCINNTVGVIGSSNSSSNSCYKTLSLVVAAGESSAGVGSSYSSRSSFYQSSLTSIHSASSTNSTNKSID